MVCKHVWQLTEYLESKDLWIEGLLDLEVVVGCGKCETEVETQLPPVIEEESGNTEGLEDAELV